VDPAYRTRHGTSNGLFRSRRSGQIEPAAPVGVAARSTRERNCVPARIGRTTQARAVVCDQSHGRGDSCDRAGCGQRSSTIATAGRCRHGDHRYDTLRRAADR
jgi:hypothetical protein